MILVALKWTGAVSDADAAALETALGLDDDVTVASVGPVDAERGLRRALAAGASRAVRVDSPADLRSDAVGRALAPLCAGASWVLCGDASPDRGSGSVPAFLAASLGVGQALGLVAVDRTVDETGDRDVDGALRFVRRLDGGRREVLIARPPTVLSVEGSVARLRRSSLPAELSAQHAAVDVVPGPSGPLDRPGAIRTYRPRPREVAMPAGDALTRITRLTTPSGGTGAAGATRAEVITAEPAAAAARIVDALRTWGYLDGATK